MIIAQISDLHLRGDGRPLRGGIDSVAALAACIRHLNALDPRPDVVLATGDLANKGVDQDYATLHRMLGELDMPVYVLPGNHDDREALRRTFADHRYLPTNGEFLHYTVEDLPLRLIGLDTVAAGADGGCMCAQRLAWLEARLDEGGGRPTLIFMHHPPFRTGIAFMDALGFDGADAMEATVRRHPGIERIICGHVHRDIQVRWGGTIASTAPSIVFQMAMDLRPDSPAAFVLEPAACPVFLWDPDTGLIGHMSVIGEFGPRQAFAMAPV